MRMERMACISCKIVVIGGIYMLQSRLYIYNQW